MCGFGDKDRRPLAPAAVAKMIVRRDDNTVVDVDDVDCSFFLVTVDLWSADGKHEMNLVLHPSSTERTYIAPVKSRRRGTSASAPHSRSSGNQTPVSQTPTSHYRPGDQSSGMPTPSLSSQTANFNSQGYFSPMAEPMGFSPATPYGTTTPETPTWGYSSQSAVDRNATFQPPILPSISSFSRAPSGSSLNGGHEPWQPEPESQALPYRAWGADTAYHPTDTFSNSQVDPALRGAASDGRDDSNWTHQQERYGQDGNAPPADTSTYPTNYNQTQSPLPPPPPYYSSNFTPTIHAPPTQAPSASAISLPRHSYTRTLVGPLSANACRLLDEHRKAGIFFLFQDLSVRTEGGAFVSLPISVCVR
ncbi:hypothetical protein H0H81_011577 [Sphagnurus paluster]|uniref:Velvet domain-containing protein n=1 Tax=Sphagnurus paluster TaxID=117069 RepID=A0A9P7GPT5_9AGAR|nr:hypothetical protein H0H81_011577 [Sphagnurus paluster]